jgi:DNA (cytosine-5)-methyltransferase 1
MAIKDLSLKLAAISLLADQAKRLKDELRAELQAEMNQLGADRVKAELGDEVVAYITTSKPKFKWVVKSDKKFIDWVKANVPSEIVESVRESSVDAILDKFNYVDELVIDPNGEPIDWLEGSQSEPFLMTKFHGDGREKLRQAIIRMKIGSLCSGYGGLDMAVEAFYGAETAFMCDIDKYASIVIKERWGVPNLGDMKQVDWSNVEPVDILTAGYPCQPFSTAGQRKGSADERHLWPYIKEIISHLQPSRVILENVRGHLTLGFKEVLQDLTEIGYDARWAIVRASDVGAPHRRERLFCVAQPTNSDRSSRQQSRGADRPISQSTSQIINGSDRNEHGSGIETVANTDSEGLQGTGNETNDIANGGVSNTDDKCESYDGQMSQLGSRFASRCEMRLRRAPNPLDLNNKLNAKFVEYMMGLPVGWVTDLDISRSQQLKLLGNGVVPQQAYYAIDKLERL